LALILVRHPLPASSHQGRCYGRLDLPAGRYPAAAARALLARTGRIDRIVSSPARRCREPAALLARRLRVPIRCDPAWREMDFGAWEGLAWEAVPRAELDAWADDLINARPHGGESVAMLLARIRRELRRLPRRGRTLVLTHAGPIRAALVATGAGPEAWNRRIPFGAAVVLDRFGGGQ
jgi:alpha-ribazole phosphatase